MDYCKGHPDVRHTDAAGKGCGGQLAITGDGYTQLPEGFGFESTGRDAGRFVIDCKRWPSYSGFCLKCGTSGTFLRIDRKGRKHRVRTKHRVPA